MIDLTAPATLTWTSKFQARQRHVGSIKEAARIAMTELTKGEFLAARIVTIDDSFEGDQIVQIYRTGDVPRRGWARF